MRVKVGDVKVKKGQERIFLALNVGNQMFTLLISGGISWKCFEYLTTSFFSRLQDEICFNLPAVGGDGDGAGQGEEEEVQGGHQQLQPVHPKVSPQDLNLSMLFNQFSNIHKHQGVPGLQDSNG